MNKRIAFTLLDLIAVLSIIAFVVIFGVPILKNACQNSRQEPAKENLESFIKTSHHSLAEANKEAVGYSGFAFNFLEPFKPVQGEVYKSVELSSSRSLSRV